jgi:indole-3-glycerol phosphate synthase
MLSISPSPTVSYPMILEAIVDNKRQEVKQMYAKLPLSKLQQQSQGLPTRKFILALQQSLVLPSIIAEVKKASPSRGVLRPDFDPIAIAQSYQRGGAACLSVLTDQKFFQGNFEILWNIRQVVTLPLLCKEFIIDPYQIYFARFKGADAVLLIASILTDTKLQEFLDLTHQLKMDALVEVHTLAELDRVLALTDVKLIGINNRNLNDFTIDLGTTINLISARRSQLTHVTIVSESGLHTRADLIQMGDAGVRSVLMGESLIKQSDIEQGISQLLL